MSERLGHGGSVGAGLLVTIKRRVHRAWAENPSFLRRGSALFNSKVLNPPPSPPVRPPLFWEAKHTLGSDWVQTRLPQLAARGPWAVTSFSILTGKMVIRPAPLLRSSTHVSPSPGVWTFPAWAASQAGAVDWGQDDEFRGWYLRDPTALGLIPPGLDGTS